MELDDDVLEIAKSVAAHRKESVGRVISEMIRKSLEHGGRESEETRNGIRIIQRGPNATVVTLDMVNKLRDEI